MVEKMERKICKLDEEEITKIYNEAYDNSEDIAKCSELAEELLTASAVLNEDNFPSPSRLQTAPTT
jgi:hypothetical protein